MRRLYVPLALFLLPLAAGLFFVSEGLQGRSGDVVCPGENSPDGSQGEEVPGPMHPGDTSCAVILPDGRDAGIRTYEQQKNVQLQAANHDLRTGAVLIAWGSAGTLWLGLTAWRSRPRPLP